MSPPEYENFYKYKLIVPTVHVINLFCLFFGSYLFPQSYLMMCLVMKIYSIYHCIVVLVFGIKAYFKSNHILDKIEAGKIKKTTFNYSKQIFYVFIIPSYKEDQDLLSQTITKLANHQNSKVNYLVFLAMEALEENSQAKARRLVQKHKGRFFFMGYTLHQLGENEQRGKASNVNWCARRLQQQFFKPNNIAAEKVLLTIIDADAWVPEAYIRQVQTHLSQAQHLKKRQRYMYHPNHIFTRNNLQVPFTTRIYNETLAILHHQYILGTFIDITFPISNYSVHFSMMKRVGWWDVNSEAIGEDMHTALKVLWKTNGEVQCIPVFTPINQLNPQSDKGYWQDIKVGCGQIARHARGINDIGYCIKMFINRPFNIRTLMGSLNFFMVSFGLTFILWGFSSIDLTKLFTILDKPLCQFSQMETLTLLTVFGLTIHVVSDLFYYLVKRRANSVLYGMKNESIFRIAENIMLVPFCVILLMIPIFIMVSFDEVINPNKEYVVAQKKTKKKEQ